MIMIGRTRNLSSTTLSSILGPLFLPTFSTMIRAARDKKIRHKIYFRETINNHRMTCIVHIYLFIDGYRKNPSVYLTLMAINQPID